MRRDELPQEGNLLAADLLPAVAPRFHHNRSMPGKKSERKGFVLFFLTHFAPHRRGIGFRVAGGQQELRLVCFQSSGWFFPARPPHKPPFREALLCQPEPLPVIKC